MSFLEYVEDFQKTDEAKSLNLKLVIGIIIFAIVLIVIVASQLIQEAGATSFQVSETQVVDESPSENTPNQICVHVAGEVLSPGICYLDEGSRVMAAIEACGGFTDTASLDALNLARELQDGEQIKVISINDAASMQTASSSEETNSTSSSVSASSVTGKININTASLSDLQTLSGIGASKAQKIIDYRESNGLFKSVDDLVNVSGIGEKTLASIKDSICV